MSETWTASELYCKYLSASGTVSRRQFLSNIKAQFGADLLFLHIEGCESILGFESSFGKYIKVTKKKESYVDDNEIDKIVRRIQNEVMTKPRCEHYQLGDFVQSKLIESTSSTLLALVSALVSRGKNNQ